MEGYLVEAFEKFLIDHLEFFKNNPESYPSSVAQLEGGFSDCLWEKVSQYISQTDWDAIWISSKPLEE